MALIQCAPLAHTTVPTAAELNYFEDIDDDDRKVYLAALFRMDFSVGRLINKLKAAGEYENTIIIYQSDNGPTGAGRNWPLRGMKGAYNEGGQRVPSFIMGPNIKPGVLNRSSFMHISDWTPTLLDFAGVDPNVNANFDGMSFKDTFVNGGDSPRSEMFYYLNPRPAGGVYRQGRYKIAYNDVVKYEKFNHTEPAEGTCHYTGLVEEGLYSTDTIAAESLNLQFSYYDDKQVLLFDLENDPYELFNIFDDNQELGVSMIDEIKAKAKTVRSIGLVSLSGTPDTDSEFYPENSKWSTSGWCDASTIVPEPYS